MELKNFFAQDLSGTVIPNPTVYLYVAGTTTLATGLADKDGDPLPNPFIGSSTGQIQLAAPDGDYDLRVTGNGRDFSMRVRYIDAEAGSAQILRDDLADSSAGKGADLVAFKDTRPGSVSRTSASILRERMRFTNRLTSAEIDDVISGAGSINLSAKWAAALADADGKVLLLPTGRIRAAGGVLPGLRSTLVGDGGLSTRITAPDATTTVLTVTASFAEIEGLTFDSAVTRSGGWYVDFAASAARSSLKQFSMDGAHGGIRTAAVASLTVSDGKLLNGVAGTGVACRINAGLDVTLRDLVIDAAADLYAGILITSSGDVTLEDLNVMHAGQALFLNPGPGQVIASVWATNSFFDTSIRGLYALANGAGAAIVRCVFDVCWFGGHSNEGVRLATTSGGLINGMDFEQIHLFLNGTDGLLVADPGVHEVHVRGGAAAENTSAGLSFGAGVSDFSVRGMRVGPAYGLGANNVGINVSPGSGANYSIENNDLRGNTTVNIADAGVTGTGRSVRNNKGDSALGFATSITVGASPFTYTAGSRPETVYLIGGTVSTVTIGGVQVANGTNREVCLSPGVSMTVTYSSVPTMSRVYQA